MFTHAIVRSPAPCLVNGLVDDRTSAALGRPDMERAVTQHGAYVAALRDCGLDVTVLPPDPRHPDATFVEDTALLTRRCAVVTRPGAPSRRPEAEAMRAVLAERFPVLEAISEPGTLDAGDVMMVGDHFFIGLSARTNAAGARQLIAILERHGLSGAVVPLQHMLHLKTGVSCLEYDTVLVTGELREAPQFAHLQRIEVPEAEAYAANSLWINDTVLVPAGHPETRARIEALGRYRIRELDVSEFRKVDGGLSCLSLRY